MGMQDMTGIQHRTQIDAPAFGSIEEGRYLNRRLVGWLPVGPSLLRRVVWYQGNRDAPGIRWSKNREGSYLELVTWLLEQTQASLVLNQFAGMGTTPLLGADRCLKATGIKFDPVGVLTGSATIRAARGLCRENFRVACKSPLGRVASGKAAT